MLSDNAVDHLTFLDSLVQAPQGDPRRYSGKESTSRAYPSHGSAFDPPLSVLVGRVLDNAKATGAL